jgi:hypothetical protein
MKRDLILLIESCTDAGLIRALYLIATHYLLRKSAE